jgi:hypothetical protein
MCCIHIIGTGKIFTNSTDEQMGYEIINQHHVRLTDLTVIITQLQGQKVMEMFACF